MPTYEYKCNECEHSFEEISRIDDRKIPCETPCPKCNKISVQQIISAVAGVVDARMNVKQKGDFKEVMQKIKSAHKYDSRANIKDY